MTVPPVKACPFCGGSRVTVDKFRGVWCVGCHAEINEMNGESFGTAITAWNRRTSPEAAALRAIREALDALNKVPVFDLPMEADACIDQIRAAVEQAEGGNSGE